MNTQHWRGALCAATTALLLYFLVLAGCSHQTNPVTLRVGYEDFYPYVAADAQGQPAGFAVDLIQQAAKRAKIGLQWVRITGAVDALTAGKIDLYPVLTVSDERRATMHFTHPWWENDLVLVSLSASPLPDVKRLRGKRIAIRQLAYIIKRAGTMLPGANLTVVREAERLMPSLCGGQIDGFVLDSRLMRLLLASMPAACAGKPLHITSLEVSLPMATASRFESADQADRLAGIIDDLVVDGTFSRTAANWGLSFPNRNAYVQEVLERRAERAERSVALVAMAGVLAVAGLYLARMSRARKRAEASEQRFHTYMSNLPAAVFTKDRQGRYLYINQRYADVFGRGLDQVYGRTDDELWDAHTASGIMENDQRVWSEREPVQVIEPAPDHTGRLRHWMVLKFQYRDADGTQRLGGAAMDVTELKAAQDRIAKSEEQFRSLFEEAPVAIHEMDREGRIRRANRAECQMLGYSEAELVGRHVWDLVSPEERELSRKAVETKLRTGDVRPFDRRCRTRDGRKLQLEIHETVVYGPTGEIDGIRSFLVDRTESRRVAERLDQFALELQLRNTELEEALALAKDAAIAKTNFLANVSHELRTPMNGLLGMTELLLDTGLSTDQRDLAVASLESGRHLLEVLNDILDYSKIEAGKLRIVRAPFSLRDLLGGILNLMGPVARAKGIGLTGEIAAECPDRVIGDLARLRQVMLNLAGNAIKFTEAGSVAVRFEGTVEGRWLTLRAEVRDTGIGIPTDAQKLLFRPFSQVDATSTRRYGGTGLGLAISKELVQAMGGGIGLESAVGAGSRFHFELKLQLQEVVVAAVVPEPLQEPRERQTAISNARVLVVEDNAVNSKLVSRVLRKMECFADLAANGVEAVEAAKRERYDAILMDVQMPEMDGMDATRAIRGLEAATRRARTPIIGLTAGARPDDRERCLAGGMDDYLSKPVHARELEDALLRWLPAAVAVESTTS